MPTIRSKTVMDQTIGPDGQVCCGVHTFKNMLLTLLLENKSITPVQYNNLLIDADFFNVIYDKFRELGLPIGDLMTSQLAHAANQIKAEIENDRLNLTAYGISNDALKLLNLSLDGQHTFSIGSFLGAVVEPDLGTLAGETDLPTAGAIAKFARSKGAGTHIFAVGDKKHGINGHWVTVVARKQDNGSYVWDSLDSWHNETAFARGIINKIEPVLNKSEEELQVYLRTAYDNRLDQFHRYYESFFDDDGQLKEGALVAPYQDPENFVIVDAKQYYVDMDESRALYFSRIKEAYTFFESANWLDNPGDEEIARIKKIRDVADFMYKNADPVTHQAMREKLGPIIEKLNTTIAAHMSSEATAVDTPVESSHGANNEAINAVLSGKPEVHTPNIFARLVQSIANLLEGIKSAITSMVDYIATAIGVKG